MSDEIMLVFGEDGVARKYDDTWDITIHCESEEEQKLVWEKLNNSNQEDCNKLAKDTNVPCKDTISRQAAIDALEKVATLFPWKVPGNRDSYDRYNEAWNDAIGRAEIEIEELPSAQPEIIRCKDCKFFREYGCQRAFVYPEPEDFCSRAERRTDE